MDISVGTNSLTLTFSGPSLFVKVLPIREVKPGVKVALFNPLGEWALNASLAIHLAPKIPPGTEVLFMPDGKAQALLHELGRTSGLPTIVAKKEKKPYMLEPVLVRTAHARPACSSPAHGPSGPAS